MSDSCQLDELSLRRLDSSLAATQLVFSTDDGGARRFPPLSNNGFCCWRSRFVQSCLKINIYHCQAGLYINWRASDGSLFSSPMFINYFAGPDIPMLDDFHVLQNPHHSVTSKCGCCQQQYNTRLKRCDAPSSEPSLRLLSTWCSQRNMQISASNP